MTDTDKTALDAATEDYLRQSPATVSYEYAERRHAVEFGWNAARAHAETQHAERVKALVNELRLYAIRTDPMSFHGELMVCNLCGSNWNNGEKRSDPATPETHKSDCLLYRGKE